MSKIPEVPKNVCSNCKYLEWYGASWSNRLRCTKTGIRFINETVGLLTRIDTVDDIPFVRDRIWCDKFVKK